MARVTQQKEQLDELNLVPGNLEEAREIVFSLETIADEVESIGLGGDQLSDLAEEIRSKAQDLEAEIDGLPEDPSQGTQVRPNREDFETDETYDTAFEEWEDATTAASEYASEYDDVIRKVEETISEVQDLAWDQIESF